MTRPLPKTRRKSVVNRLEYQYRNQACVPRRPVLTKADFARRFEAGEFGNRNRVWANLEEWGEDPYVQHTNTLYHLRNKRVAGGETYYNVDPLDMGDLWRAKAGPEPDLSYGGWFIAEMAPHNLNRIQGEVMRTHEGLVLYYSGLTKMTMRDALRALSSTYTGLKAQMLLRSELCHASYEWLMHLLDLYPDHVVEFSTFSKPWGVLPGMNTVFWEVRRY